MDFTPDRHYEILSAWIDGEPSEPAAVQAALETPEGRAFVVDAMSLRRVVDVTTTTAARDVLVAERRRPRWIPAAAAALVCMAAGYGMARVTSPAVPARPPIDAAIVVPAGGPSAPQPTHVIRFESGVDWRETVGGN